jgi:hypothetical protein
VDGEIRGKAGKTLSYKQAVKWEKKHRKGTRQPMIMSTGSGFWPSGAFLEKYWEYEGECKSKGEIPLSAEQYYDSTVRRNPLSKLALKTRSGKVYRGSILIRIRPKELWQRDGSLSAGVALARDFKEPPPEDIWVDETELPEEIIVALRRRGFHLVPENVRGKGSALAFDTQPAGTINDWTLNSFVKTLETQGYSVNLEHEKQIIPVKSEKMAIAKGGKVKDTFVKVNPTDIQSLLFDKAKWTVERAKKWLKKRGFRTGDLGKGGPRADYYHFTQFKTKKPFRYRNMIFGSKGLGIKSSIEFRGPKPASVNPKAKRNNPNPGHGHFHQSGAYLRPRTNPTVRRNDPEPDRFRGGLGRPSSRLHDPDPRSYRSRYAFGEGHGVASRLHANPSPYPETRARWQRERIQQRRAMYSQR